MKLTGHRLNRKITIRNRTKSTRDYYTHTHTTDGATYTHTSSAAAIYQTVKERAHERWKHHLPTESRFKNDYVWVGFLFFWIFSFFYFKETQKLLQNSRKKHFFRTLNLVLSKFILRRSLIFLIKLFVFYLIFSQTNYVFLLTHFILSLMLLQVIHIGFTKCVWERKTLRRFSSETSKQNNRTARTDGINVNVSNVSTYLVERHKNDKCQKITECKG